MTGPFTTREVAKILGLSESRVRACVRVGVLSPLRGRGRRHEFTFQDLLLLKTTKGLLDARVPLKRIRRILHSLKRQLPVNRQLSSLTIYADGRRIVVWDGTARWQPDSGQFLFNFGTREIEQATPLAAAPEPAPSSLTAEQWFDLASELEKHSPQESRRAYQQALELDPSMVAAHINLGRLHHQAKELEHAESHYRAALRHAPDDALAHFNLAVLLEDRGHPEDAVRAYRQALALDPDFADAHYNLALLFEAQGRRSEAITHFRAARRLYSRSADRG